MNYNDVAQRLSFAELTRLQAVLSHPETKVWRRKLVAVSKVRKGSGENPGQVVSVKYEPQSRGQQQDPGAIETSWLPDPTVTMIGETAKAGAGMWAVFYQTNIGKTDDRPHGYRRLVWLEVPSAPTERRSQPQTQQQPNTEVRPEEYSRVPPDEPIGSQPNTNLITGERHHTVHDGPLEGEEPW